MNVAPFLLAPLAIQIHVLAVVPSAVLGAYLLVGRKGTPNHRLLDKIWIALMVIGALSSFFIHAIRLVGPFSPIHLISIYVLYACYDVYSKARAGHIAAHRKAVIGLYLGGIVGAGIFTLLPGRMMNRIFLSDLAGPLVLVLLVGLVYGGTFLVRRYEARAVSR